MIPQSYVSMVGYKKWADRGLYDVVSDAFGQLEMDPVANADMVRVPLPVPAGSVVCFGPFLAHATGPNHTDRDRRALLYSYQPAGMAHSIVKLRRLFHRAPR